MTSNKGEKKTNLYICLEDFYELEGTYKFLTTFGNCVDYEDAEQMKLKKPIIIGRVTKVYSSYHNNDKHNDVKDCFVMQLQKAYPMEFLHQKDRIFRLMCLGDIIKKLLQVKVGSFIAFMLQETVSTYGSNFPSFILGPNAAVIWELPNVKFQPSLTNSEHILEDVVSSKSSKRCDERNNRAIVIDSDDKTETSNILSDVDTTIIMEGPSDMNCRTSTPISEVKRLATFKKDSFKKKRAISSSDESQQEEEEDQRMKFLKYRTKLNPSCGTGGNLNRNTNAREGRLRIESYNKVNSNSPSGKRENCCGYAQNHCLAENNHVNSCHKKPPLFGCVQGSNHCGTNRGKFNQNCQRFRFQECCSFPNQTCCDCNCYNLIRHCNHNLSLRHVHHHNQLCNQCAHCSTSEHGTKGSENENFIVKWINDLSSNGHHLPQNNVSKEIRPVETYNRKLSDNKTVLKQREMAKDKKKQCNAILNIIPVNETGTNRKTEKCSEQKKFKEKRKLFYFNSEDCLEEKLNKNSSLKDKCMIKSGVTKRNVPEIINKNVIKKAVKKRIKPVESDKNTSHKLTFDEADFDSNSDSDQSLHLLKRIRSPKKKRKLLSIQNSSSNNYLNFTSSGFSASKTNKIPVTNQRNEKDSTEKNIKNVLDKDENINSVAKVPTSRSRTVSVDTGDKVESNINNVTENPIESDLNDAENPIESNVNNVTENPIESDLNNAENPIESDLNNAENPLDGVINDCTKNSTENRKIVGSSNHSEIVIKITPFSKIDNMNNTITEECSILSRSTIEKDDMSLTLNSPQVLTPPYFDAEGSHLSDESADGEYLKNVFKTLSDQSSSSLEKLFADESPEIRERILSRLRKINQKLKIRTVLIDINPPMTQKTKGASRKGK